MREPFIRHRGIAAVLMLDNVDTDQIIPSCEMKTVSRKGLGEGLFAGWRYTVPGGREPAADFVLNRPEQTGTSILIAGRNFGCGSSREHAVWALAEYGLKAIIARSFGDIFYGNCLNNTILPVVLADEDIDWLSVFAGGTKLEIDLERQAVTSLAEPSWMRRFEIDAFPKRLLLEGLDPIRLTLKQKPEIDAFLEADRAARPWLYL